MKRAISFVLILTFALIQLPAPANAHDFVIPGGTTANPPGNPNYAGQTSCQGAAISCASEENMSKAQGVLDPVYFDRGEFLYQHTDLTLPGCNINLELKRTYRSNSTYHSPFGYGWDTNYNLRIRKMSDGSFTFLTGTDRKEAISASGQGPAGFYDTLTTQQDGTFLLTRKHGDKIYFDADGNATRVEDRFGNTLTFTYYDGGRLPLTGPSDYFVNQAEGVVALESRLRRVADSLGRYFDFFYDSRGRLDHVTDSTGRTIVYTYDSSNDLRTFRSPVTTEYPEGLTTGYSYNVHHKLETITDPKGQVYVTNHYNGDGKLDSQTMLGYGATNIIYNLGQSTSDITDRKGFRVLWTFDTDGRPVRKEEFTQNIHPDDPASFVTTYLYDSNGEMTRVTFPRGNFIQNTFDTKGNLLEERRKPIPGSQDPDIVTTYTYEPNFNFIKTMTDPRGNVTTYTYDYEIGQGNQGKLMRITYPPVNGQTIETQFTYNNFGQIISVTDPNGIVTKYTYNSGTGYLETITQGFGTQSAAVITLGYDSFGNISSIRDARSFTTTFEQNALRQLKKVIAPSPFHYQTLYDYDRNGNLSQVRRQSNNQGSEFQTTSYTYTPLDQLTTMTDALNNVTQFQYDNNGNRIKVIDPELRETSYVYDERNLLFTVTDARNALTQYDYDSNSNLKRIKDANTNTTEYHYDDFDRLLHTTYPDSNVESYTYDPASNLSTKTTPNGEVIRYTYDELNRLTLKEYVSCAVSRCGGDIQYHYDQGSRLKDAGNSNTQTFFQYDPLNRMTQEKHVINAVKYLITSSYDKQGNRTLLTYPSKPSFAYTYDSLNRLSAISRYKIAIPFPTPIVSNTLFKFIYDPLSRRTLLYRNPVNLQTTYTYDPINRMTSITTTPNLIGFIGYPEYDRLGNRKREQNNIIPNHHFDYSYTYNERYELTSVQDQSPRFEYQYDLTGNRLTSNEEGESTTYTPNNLNQYSSVNNQNYQYDHNGNLINDGQNTYEYDYENRLIHVVMNSGEAIYQYDPFGRRLAKLTSNTATVSIHDQDQILERYTCSFNLTNCSLNQSFIYSNRIDEPLLLTTYNPATTIDYYYHHDALGSTTALTDTQQRIAEFVQYDPYGKPHFFNAQGEAIPSSTVNNPYLFTGREYDTETRLQFSRNRTYSYELGRFLQRDPIGIMESEINLFRYVQNNPTNLIDPSGSFSILPPILIAIYLILTNPDIANAPGENSETYPSTGVRDMLIDAGISVVAGVVMGGCPSSKMTQGARDSAKRFIEKAPKGAHSFTSENLKAGLTKLTYEVPARNIPGSRAVYEKIIDSSGNVISVRKITYDAQGNIVHIKDKLNG